MVKDSVVANIATTAADGKTYQVDYYNPDAVISVGYRVKSITTTRFRQWATARLKECIQKGFTLDDEHPERQRRGQPLERSFGSHPGHPPVFAYRKKTVPSPKTA